MTETLRDYDPTQTSSAFPLNAGISAEDLGREDVDSARSRIYTAWWTHILSNDPDFEYPPDSRPLYQITCSTEAESRVAWAIKPSFVDVVLHIGGETLELPEPGKQFGEE
jgi:hypothetical protein